MHSIEYQLHVLLPPVVALQYTSTVVSVLFHPQLSSILHILEFALSILLAILFLA